MSRDIFANLSAEWWSTVGQLIERRLIRIPNDEKLVAQLTSRRQLYDSRGREKLEAKAALASRGVESPDRADALIGSVMLGLRTNPYLFDRNAHQMNLRMMQEVVYQLQAIDDAWGREHISFSREPGESRLRAAATVGNLCLVLGPSGRLFDCQRLNPVLVTHMTSVRFRRIVTQVEAS